MSAATESRVQSPQSPQLVQSEGSEDERMVPQWSQLVYGTGPKGRHMHMASSFSNSMILVGGQGSDGVSGDRSIYRLVLDPAACWTEVSSQLPSPITQGCCCSDGERIYIIGGWDPINMKRNHHTIAISEKATLTNTQEDLSTPSSPTDIDVTLLQTEGEQPGGVTFSSAAEVNKKIYAFGGRSTCSESRMWVFDPDKLTWSVSTATTTSKRSSHSLTAIGERLFVFGGISEEGVASGDIFSYDTVTNTFTRPLKYSGTAPSPRYGHAACSFGSQLFIHGGYSTDDTPLSDLFVIDLSQQDPEWQSLFTKNAPPATAYHSLCVLSGVLCLFGGKHAALATNDNNDIWMLDIDTQEEVIQPESEYSVEENEETQ
eukprot:TRINITY_DN27632_c0_g1_i1.p1 TRINITY_DN27632_c0_g1~~TRINITY_DN27632_c0_g1_i1.p1  ORF type:complete len:397 (+),score=72.87 TRINITY_DN27632_c0_g1_i1:73-1191(+)